MDSFLSGFSRGFTGSVGTGYAGSVSGVPSVAGGQNVDVTQLKPGDTFQGEITSVNGEDVQIQLANGQYMTAKLARDVQLALGQVMNLQVQSNKDNHVVLKPVYDGRAQMLRVGEAALRAANMAVNEKNLQLVSKLLENGMSIDKNTLMTYNRLALQNTQIDLSNIIKLNKLQLPVTQENARQLQNYQNLEHKILDGVKTAADELVKTFDSILGEGTPLGSVPSGALENGAKFMEQVLALLGGEDAQETGAAANTGVLENGAVAEIIDGENGQNGQNGQNTTDTTNTANAANITNTGNEAIQEGTKVILNGLSKGIENTTPDKSVEQVPKGEELPLDKDAGKRLTNEVNNAAESETKGGQTQSANVGGAAKGTQGEAVKEFVALLKGEPSDKVPDKVIHFINTGKIGIKEMKQLLLDTDLGKI